MHFPLDGTDELYSLKLTWNSSPGSTLVATLFSDPTTKLRRRRGRSAADLRRLPDDHEHGARHLGVASAPSAPWTTGSGSGRSSAPPGSSASRRRAIRTASDWIRSQEGLAVRISDFTCAGGTEIEPCAPTGRGELLLGRIRQPGRPRQQQPLVPRPVPRGREPLLRPARAQARRGLSGRLDDERIAHYSGGQLVADPQSSGARSTTSTSSSPDGVQQPDAVLREHTGEDWGGRRVPAGLLEGGAGRHGQRGTPVGPGEPARLPGRRGHPPRGTNGSRAWASPGTPGATARRTCMPSRAASTTRCRPTSPSGPSEACRRA